jgi:hypothetical protein
MYHAGFSQIATSNPARVGETIVLLATGLGPVSPAVPAGEASPQNPLAQVVSCFSSRLGPDGYYFGLMPGLAGVFQINVSLPTAETIRALLPRPLEGPWFIYNVHSLCEPSGPNDGARSAYRRLSLLRPP